MAVCAWKAQGGLVLLELLDEFCDEFVMSLR
jgi:hypothetical protein